ncbi:MAG TPA: putative toxin-antitoxin system toxin component, PIN family [Spirochaetota bacterium]|nr:putative toxin-antitoxin system toxin component, PIN family [Spirochaetota bacterium]
MIKVVLDSNVYISGILFHGKPRDLVDRAVRGSITVYISPAILEEVKDVLGRAKFGFPPARIAAIAGEIESIAIQVVPERKYSVVPRDSDDTIVIDCAMESKADFIVTGDNDLLSMGHYEGIQIVSPADFLRMQNE